MASVNGMASGQTANLFEQDLRDVLGKESPAEQQSTDHDLLGGMTNIPIGVPGQAPTGDLLQSQTQHQQPHMAAHYSVGRPQQAGQGGGDGSTNPTLQAAVAKLDSFKQWSVSTFKCTKQLVAERMGKSSRTLDPELEGQIEGLRDLQRRYQTLLAQVRVMTGQFSQLLSSHQLLATTFEDLSSRQPELREELSYNHRTQANLHKNGHALIQAMQVFTTTVSTLCSKTIEDTLQTIRKFESARLQYDAYRTESEALNAQPRVGTTVAKQEDAKRKLDKYRARHDSLKQDVTMKMKFLEENRVKVMHKQLLLFHNAVSAYFSGNQAQLEATMKQFSIKLKQPNTEGPSFLE